MNIYIYKLSHPTTKEIRYIGKTNNTSQRLYNHIRNAKSKKYKRHVFSWINSLLRQNLLPIMEVLEICNLHDWKERETYWIDKIKSEGSKLCNHTLGGEGRSGLKVISEETALLIEQKMKSGLYFQIELEKELGLSKGYICNLAKNRNITLAKAEKKKSMPSRKGTFCGKGKARDPSKGIHYCKTHKKWCVKVYKDDKRTTLGYYTSNLEAEKAKKDYNTN